MDFSGYRIFISDYDGTLAGDLGKVSQKTRSTLNKIGDKDVIRIIATGRSLNSFKSVVEEDFPVDYLVCSSGIGIYDWKNKELLQKSEINSKQTGDIYNYLVNNGYDFMVQLPVPHNHFFHHFCSGRYVNPDFRQRLKNYEADGLELISDCPVKASQFVVICPEDKGDYEKISKKFRDVNVIKATSPIDGKSVWIEILPLGISKASGVEFIRNKLAIATKNMVSVGNDYYDLEMLNYTDRDNSYVVSNSPDELKKIFKVIGSNVDDGVAELIEKLYLLGT